MSVLGSIGSDLILAPLTKHLYINLTYITSLFYKSLINTELCSIIIMNQTRDTITQQPNDCLAIRK